MKKKMGEGRESKLTLEKLEENMEGGNETEAKINIKEITLKRKEFWKLQDSEGMRKIEDLGNFFT